MDDTSNNPEINAILQHLETISDELCEGHLSIFAGAGISQGVGFSGWQEFLTPIIQQLDVNPNIDLTKVAQYYENEYGRYGISRLVNTQFYREDASPNPIIKRLATLPIHSYWTTNYDSEIEDTLRHQGLVVDVKIRQEQFKHHSPNSNVTVYKMHGDKNFPDEVVLTKNDYEIYDLTREVFTKALSVELITNTFLFIGFSFSDPNLDRIISIARHSFKDSSAKNHYCFMRRVHPTDEIYCDNQGYFLSFHYQQDHAIANQIRLLLAKTSDYCATEEEKLKQQDQDSIKKWINKKLCGSAVTILIWHNETPTRKLVQYEIKATLQQKKACVVLTNDKSQFSVDILKKAGCEVSVPDEYFEVIQLDNLTSDDLTIAIQKAVERKVAFYKEEKMTRHID